jgi:hypothetical protein
MQELRDALTARPGGAYVHETYAPSAPVVVGH